MKISRWMKTIVVRLLAAAVILCGMWGGFGSIQVDAATPRVMLSDYLIEEGVVTAGKEFTLTLTLQNTAAKSEVRNIKVSVFSENGEFLPTEGAGTAYLDKIEAAGEASISFPMCALDGLQEMSYKVSVKTEYEDVSGNSYEVTDSIYLSITLEQRLSVTDVYLADYDVQLGDTVEVCGIVNNLGKGTLYNVTAHIEGDNVMEQESYIGNIESGKSGSIDALTKAAVISHNSGDKNYLIITYEDKAGNVYTEKTMISLNVSQPIYENLEKVKETPDVSAVVKQIIVALLIAAALLFVIRLIVRHRKRKQQMLDEI